MQFARPPTVGCCGSLLTLGAQPDGVIGAPSDLQSSAAEWGSRAAEVTTTHAERESVGACANPTIGAIWFNPKGKLERRRSCLYPQVRSGALIAAGCRAVSTVGPFYLHSIFRCIRFSHARHRTRKINGIDRRSEYRMSIANKRRNQQAVPF